MGNIQWNKTYDYLNSACAVVKTADGGYALAGNGNNGIMLLRTDSQGNVQWNQTFGSTPKEIANPTGIGANSLIETSDGGFALAGSANPGGSSSGYYYLLIKTTSVLPPPPSPSVPEFPSEVIVAALFTVIVALAVFLKRKN